MNEFENILVATDFSDNADGAFSTAARLATQLGANLHIVHIVQVHPTSKPETGNASTEELEAIEEKAAKDGMDKYLAEVAGDVSVSTSIVNGDPATEVNRLVNDKQADLIVIGTHGRSGLSRLIMGSVAESVMKKSNVPVVCVKSN